MKHDGYDPRPHEDLLTAAEAGDLTAVAALTEFNRLKAAERPVVIECHRRHGWRVHEPCGG